MPGGTNAGPNPLDVVCASLGTCQEITYKYYAGVMGINADSISCKVEAPIDLGGLVGLGGGVVMVPLMVNYARMTQHAAVGPSSSAVAAAGASGCLSFCSSGAVDFAAAAAISGPAMVGARFGARLTPRFDSTQLSRTFAVFQLCVAPLVPRVALRAQQIGRAHV